MADPIDELLKSAGPPSKKAAPAPKDAAPKDAKADAMRDLGEALERKDYSGAALAFQRAYEACGEHAEAEYEADVDEEI